ncbi:hypothetical protein [Microcoleus sp. FACHB-672]|uniref:hypothetical protein n=1 Tax=Microcoleus sp. FACHB-672 TaxID=2692825 RepID=UPI001681DE95|nr:hypothetical protein [Microcoleus sp. FACHB-672]MBD2040781.1 hypothetical protein [Microcoleus sp. FACHB-672]
MSVAMISTNSTRRFRSIKSDITGSSAKITPITQTKLTSVAPLTGNQSVAPLTGNQSVKILPTPGNTPLWLSWLVRVQQSSSLLTLISVAACLSVYGWTVYCQQVSGNESRKLNNLRRQEQQLAAANAVIKHQIAQQAELPGSELVPPDPSQIIFLEPAPPRTKPAIPPVPDPQSSAGSKEAVKTPLGY